MTEKQGFRSWKGRKLGSYGDGNQAINITKLLRERC
jgi:hypothetical protein